MTMNGNSSTSIPPEVLRVKQRYSIIGNAPALINAVQRALQVAPIDLSVLIIGESGSGKEFFPNIIHDFSARKHSKYIAVNCGAIPEGTIDSELFGHEKGAFTGAVARRIGHVEKANTGTLFLDEVGDLSLASQVKLLRFIQERTFTRLGSSQTLKSDVRLIAATSRNLEEMIANGQFREDLYYRLNIFPITMPDLNSRRSDIILLAVPSKFISDVFSELLSYINKKIIIINVSKGLESNTNYTFKIVAYDVAGNELIVNNNTFQILLKMTLSYFLVYTPL